MYKVITACEANTLELKLNELEKEGYEVDKFQISYDSAHCRDRFVVIMKKKS